MTSFIDLPPPPSYSSERLNLLYFNNTQADIWLEDKLQSLHESDERFSCKHILSQEAGQTGRISQQLLEPFFKKPPAETFSFALICGPTGFNTAAVDSLKELKLQLNQIHVFQA